MGVDKSMIGRIFSRPLLWFATRPPEKGAKTPIFALLSPGRFFTICNLNIGGIQILDTQIPDFH